MGYRVGIQCLGSQTEADDLILSAASPTITADGQLVRPQRQTDGWYLNGQKITLSHPPCDPMQQFAEGAQIGTAFVILMAVVFGFRLVLNFVKSLGSPQGVE